jgi:hypothetical protein
MVLFLNGISGGVQCTNVGYWIKDHESAFELLTNLVADNWTLQEVTVVDGTDHMSVPVEVFDGQPIQVHIRALQREWQQLLSDHPVPENTLNKQQLKDWYTQLEAYYDDMLTYLGKMISILELRKARLTTQRNESLRLRLGQQYDLLLQTNRRMYKQTKGNRLKNKKRLNNLNRG